ncbi:Bax inhibitor-1/YccA family protein [Rhizobium laguerreae]|uniref:Bax inhibitor-1/YccA family protein n=1 Tax=Rhizobium laguerreae TaxID=1076926 RepID=UPI001C8FC634|nr:Bax inhibitor-1/YccA family protein [Rhizobium laguerreae]MBY3151157.1 Bax inhibitor-1/YccA family protein [Rhizobium laguerreae]
MQQNLNSTYGQQDFDTGLRDHMTKTYGLIAGGLAVSAMTAWVIGFTPLRSLVVGEEGLTAIGHIGLWAPLLLLLGAGLFRAGSVGAARGIYWAFVALQGIGLSLVAISLPAHTIVQALAITGFTFGAMSLWGYTTKRSLSGWGNFLLMGLIGIIIASIVNLFLGSAALDFSISVIGVLVFSGFTAYDTQKLKDMYYSGLGKDDLEYARYWSALGLYLNIVNLFNFFVSLGRD